MGKARDGEYQIMPESEINALKSKLKKLSTKKKKSTSSTQVVNSMNELTSSVNTMLHLFQSAAGEMKKEDLHGPPVSKEHTERFSQINSKLDTLIDQNKTIAVSHSLCYPSDRKMSILGTPQINQMIQASDVCPH